MALRSFRLLSPLTVVAALAAAAWVAACGSTDGSKFDDGHLNDQNDASYNTSSGFSSSGTSGLNGEGGPGSTDQLKIDPPTLTVTATGTLSSLSGTGTFKAFVNGAKDPVEAKWSVDDAGIGSIDGTGVFKTAAYAGKTTVRARVGNLVATAEVNVVFKIDENPGNVTDDQKTKLNAGGNADTTAFKWLYPYDKTVFPRGLLPPKLMFGGAVPTAYFVKLTTKNVEYSGYYKADGPQPRVIVSNDWWNMVTRSAGANDPVKIQVTKIDGTNVTGPIEQTWSIAQGSLKGTVFYNTYNSKAVRAANAVGAVMRLRPGNPVEVFIGKKTVSSVQPDGTSTKDVTSYCTVCHSVAANGTALVAGLNWGQTNTDCNDGDLNNPCESAIFSISPTGEATPRFSTTEGRQMPFGGLSFDGKWLVGSASAYLRGLADPYSSLLYNAETGAVVDTEFFGKVQSGDGAKNRKAVSPSFSPDSTKLAFGDREADASGHQISITDVNLAANPPTFTNKVQLASNPSEVVGWPSFLPDSRGVLYGSGTTYDTGGGTSTAQLTHFCGELQWVDAATKLAAPLDLLNGYGPGKQPYLPFAGVLDPDTANGNPTPCNTQDMHMNYEPTVLPVAVGGYYWVVFTSRRAYGNFIWQGAGSVTPTGDLPFDNTQEKDAEGNETGVIKGYRKKLWVAAIDINGQPGTDISHPAFLLEGQEMEAGNMRGFWALDPCKADGAGCGGGDECCNGFCRSVDDGDGGARNACVPPPTGCANDSEKCSVTADCCNAPDGTTCINHVCTAPTPGGVH